VLLRHREFTAALLHFVGELAFHVAGASAVFFRVR
jgi:hypothetical protein